MNNNYPPILYKYISWRNEYHQKILLQNEMYFSSIEQFNDPFDSAAPVRFDLDSDDSNRERLTEIFKRAIRPEFLNRVPQMVDQYLQKGLHKQKSTIFNSNGLQALKRANNYGVFSLSETRDNLLMWSHYADSHNGICIGFDISLLDQFKQAAMKEQEVLYDIYQVRYVSDFPILVPDQMSVTEREEIAIMPFLYKAEGWHYEKEYRLICINGARQVLRYPPELIKQILLGARFDTHAVDLITIIRELGYKPDFYIAELNPDKYQIDFHQVS